MHRVKQTREVVLQLKQVREEKGYSLQKILDMTLASGGNISMTTVRRVFADGSEDQNFRYEDTIQPIASALLAVEAVNAPLETEADAELQALRSLVRLKNVIIEEMSVDAEKVRQRENEIKEDAQKKINYLKEQIAFKEERIRQQDKLLDERRDFIYRKDRIIAALAIALALSLLVIIGALVVDKINPDMGFFWLNDMAAHFANAGLDLAWTDTGIKI